jgi:D-alanyl-D-alanine carboxypeptidase (penicillin-binding protein 5/6)
MKTSERRAQRSTRGLWTRLAGILIGALIAGSLIGSLTLPISQAAAKAHLVTKLGTTLNVSVSPPLVWPSSSSAAFAIPSAGVRISSHDTVRPIASLTKMMTAYVTLRHLPLAQGATGPCVTITADDVATFSQMSGSDQSSVRVVEGESLCESQLLAGLLVHSANNFSLLLASMVAGNSQKFVRLMNQTARKLGLSHTHYVEPSGYLSGSVSTASEQVTLAEILMRSSLVRALVIQPSVALPVAGTVRSFTPLVGTHNVIGVKSGHTAEAGGCDAMAMTYLDGRTTRVVYSVILGIRGANDLALAGKAALDLATTALANERSWRISNRETIARVGWGPRVVPVTLRRSAVVHWWVPTGFKLVLHLRTITTALRKGQIVGWLGVRGSSTTRLALVAQGSVSPPSFWQRLR